MSSSGLTLAAGETQEIEYALVTSFDSTAANMPLNSVAKLQTDIQHVRGFYDQHIKPNCYATTVPVGVHDLVADAQVSLYPNPASENVTVRVAGGSSIEAYEVLDILGKTVLSSREKNDTQVTVPVTQLQNGVYFLKLSIGGRQVVKKIVKE
jgi:hypothetical protein